MPAQIVRGTENIATYAIDRQEASAIANSRLSERPRRRSELSIFPCLSPVPESSEFVAAQQSGPGFVLSFELRGGKPAADQFVAALQLITLAPSLGEIFDSDLHSGDHDPPRNVGRYTEGSGGIAPGLVEGVRPDLKIATI